MARADASKCPICCSGASRAFTTAFARVAKCENTDCGHLFALFPEAKRGVHEHDLSNVRLYKRRNELLVHELLAAGIVGKGARVLDVGAGLGHISAELKRQAPGVDIVCAETAPASVRHLREAGFNVVEDISSVDLGTFDFMLLVELIEHVEDPVGLMTQCRNMLNHGGRIFLTTPSGELRNGSHDTAAYRVPEHIQFFTERSLHKLATRCNFVNFKQLDMPQFYAGPQNKFIKTLKDRARALRNLMQGKHHFVITLEVARS